MFCKNTEIQRITQLYNVSFAPKQDFQTTHSTPKQEFSAQYFAPKQEIQVFFITNRLKKAQTPPPRSYIYFCGKNKQQKGRICPSKNAFCKLLLFRCLLRAKKQGTYFKIQGTYFKIHGLYFSQQAMCFLRHRKTHKFHGGKTAKETARNNNKTTCFYRMNPHAQKQAAAFSTKTAAAKTIET